MPTKPTEDVPEWAANADYVGGPKVGTPTKISIPSGYAAEGHRPGKDDPTLVQYWNDWLHLVWALVHWIYLGSFNGEADAHPLETDSTGQLKLARLHVKAPDGDGYSEGLFVEANATDRAVRIRSTNAADAVLVQNAGAGPGMSVVAVANTALIITGGSGPTVGALESTGIGNAPGIIGTGGPSGADGVQGFGTGNNAAGCYGEALKKGVSGKATDGAAGSFGVLGVADGDALPSAAPATTAAPAPRVESACSAGPSTDTKPPPVAYYDQVHPPPNHHRGVELRPRPPDDRGHRSAPAVHRPDQHDEVPYHPREDQPGQRGRGRQCHPAAPE
jgi:hypothetical protein